MHIQADAFLFDLDGTLINSLAVIKKVWGEWAIENGLDPKTVVDNCHGRRSIDTIRMFAPHLSLPQANDEFIDREAAETDGLLVLPGAIDFLKSLPPERWAIVTSCSKKLADVRMNYLGIPKPKVIVLADDVTQGKPDPQGYLLAAHQLGFAAEKCVVFEDAPAGIEAGKRAGMSVVVITATQVLPTSAENAVVDYRSIRLLSKEPLKIEIQK